MFAHGGYPQTTFSPNKGIVSSYSHPEAPFQACQYDSIRSGLYPFALFCREIWNLCCSDQEVFERSRPSFYLVGSWDSWQQSIDPMKNSSCCHGHTWLFIVIICHNHTTLITQVQVGTLRIASHSYILHTFYILLCFIYGNCSLPEGSVVKDECFFTWRLSFLHASFIFSVCLKTVFLQGVFYLKKHHFYLANRHFRDNLCSKDSQIRKPCSLCTKGFFRKQQSLFEQLWNPRVKLVRLGFAVEHR